MKHTRRHIPPGVLRLQMLAPFTFRRHLGSSSSGVSLQITARVRNRAPKLAYQDFGEDGAQDIQILSDTTQHQDVLVVLDNYSATNSAVVLCLIIFGCLGRH